MIDIFTKTEEAIEAIEMLEIVKTAIDRKICTGNDTIIRDVCPQSLDFVIDKAINSIRRSLE